MERRQTNREIIMIIKYNIDDLHLSVNDIYTQYDEGEISLAEATRLLKQCCQCFLNDGECDGKN